MLAGIISVCRQYLNRKDNLMTVYSLTDVFLFLLSFIFFLYFVTKELIKRMTLRYHVNKKDDIALSCYFIIKYSKR